MTAPLDDRKAILFHVEHAVASIRRTCECERYSPVRTRLLEMAGHQVLKAASEYPSLSADLAMLGARVYQEAERWPVGDNSALQAVLDDLETIAKELRK